MDKIIVLLSSYNGDSYLREQLDSIFQQINVEVEVLVRSDGSTNPLTKQILEEYARHNRLQFYEGENIGAGRSFFDLVEKAGNSNYYCFADQDDYWMPSKLCEAIMMLKKEDQNIPVLYFCNYNLSNAEGEIIQHSVKRCLKLTKGNALLESFAPGCSMVFNKALLDKVRSHMPDKDIIHDKWFYLTAMFFGKVIYDDRPFFNYRQHGGNVIGAQTLKDKNKDIKRIIADARFSMSERAKLFLRIYEKELPADDIQIIKNCADYKYKWKSMMALLFCKTYRLAYGGVKRRLYWKIRIALKRL